ncbi:MAG TPA: TetR family transcriptional regulator [Ornithinibacter sp.]|nr:TetR family transcriptional regulator [Ornithinibacter sp.]
MTLRNPLTGDGCSLRTRKREETRVALVRAAYAIVRDAGYEHLTAEAVADRAGVSRRTFFNYFPSVESVLTASVTEFFASVGDRLDARPIDEDVLDSALAVVTDPGDVDLVERIGVLAAAGEASPHARGLILVELHAWLDWLEGWLRGRLGPGVTDLYVATLASTLVGAAEAAFRVWLRAAAPRPDAGATASAGSPASPASPASTHSPSLQAGLATAIDHVRSGLDPERATGAAHPR